MRSSHNSVARLINRSWEELRATRAIALETSWPEARNTFRAKLDIQTISRNGFRESLSQRDRLLRKHETVLKYLEKRFGDFYATYSYGAALPPVNSGFDSNIWVCWWQGLDNAPELVKACIQSVRRNSGGREVVVITSENVWDYVHFPDFVTERRERGQISRTHMSDLLRLSLLAQYGGLWLDATFFCAAPLVGGLYDAPMFTIKRPDYLHASVACGRFAGYSLGCDWSKRRVFATIRDFAWEYWRRETFLVDYLLVDYLIEVACRHDKSIGAAFSAVEPNNPDCDELVKILGHPYSREKWNSLTASTGLFKLTWKQEFPADNDGSPTFYGAIVDGVLE